MGLVPVVSFTVMLLPSMLLIKSLGPSDLLTKLIVFSMVAGELPSQTIVSPADAALPSAESKARLKAERLSCVGRLVL